MPDFCVRSADAPFDPFGSAAAAPHAQVSRVRLTAVSGFVLAGLILLGWAWDVALLKSGIPGQRATQPLTAVCLALCAISLALSTERCVLCRVFRRVCALVVLFIVVATVWQNALDVDWGLDQLLFPDAIVHEQTGQFLRPGRPAGGTLIALALLCFCLLLTEARSAGARALYAWFATVGVLFAATVLLAYAFGLQALYTMGFYAQVAFTSGLELAVLFFGVLLRRPDVGWVRFLADDSAGAASARRLLLWTGALLVVLAAIVKLGTATAVHGAAFEVTVLALGGFGLLLVALLAHARRLNALEASRHSVISDLRAAETQLVRAAHDKHRHLSTLAHELRNPLTPLRNGIEIIRQASGDNPALSRTLEMMSRQIGQLLRLADNLVGAQSPLQDATDSAGTLAEAAVSGRLRILIADDNVDGADSLAMLLQAQGHVVLTACDGGRAVEVAEAFRPDVILMDVAMPHLDGLEATREIRRRPWGEGIRIIALTAWGQEAERRRTQAAGMNAHLVKPVDPHALTAVLRAGE